MSAPGVSIIIWGPRASGKTSLITGIAYAGMQNGDLLRYDAGIDKEAREMLDENIDRLLRGVPRPVVPTHTAKPMPVHFRLKDGRVLEIRDVRGEVTTVSGGERQLADDRDEHLRLHLAGADMVLFVFDPTARLHEQYISLMTGMTHVPDTGRAYLAVTKCEQLLAPDDQAWTAYPGWWQDVEAIRRVSQGREELWRQLGDRVWPVSLYGYAPESSKPAALLSEFGELCPWNIQPKNILAMLKRMVDAR